MTMAVQYGCATLTAGRSAILPLLVDLGVANVLSVVGVRCQAAVGGRLGAGFVTGACHGRLPCINATPHAALYLDTVRVRLLSAHDRTATAMFSPRHPPRCCAMNHVLGSAESCFRVGCVCISPWLLQVIILCSEYQFHACGSPSAVLWHVDYASCCGHKCKGAFADGNGIGVRASPRTNNLASATWVATTQVPPDGRRWNG